MASTYLGKPYYPTWLDNLADDVTGEGPAWDGAIQGAAAVHEVVVAAKEIYEFQEFHYAGHCGENSFLEDYTAAVRGVPLYVIVLVVFNAAGKAQRLVVNHRPRSSVLVLSRAMFERFAGHTPCQTLGRHTIRSEEREMSDLLEVAVAAHGGLARWNGITSIEVAASITGATWFVKGKGDALKNVRFEGDTTRERLTMDFVGQDKRSIFEPSRVVIQRGDGAFIDSRDDPERSFDGHVVATPWDDIHVAYFSGEALWAYLTTPFLYTWPGFVTEEITPIQVGGETWRRLTVTFPDHIKTHTREQISCFGPDGLLRRQDYTVDILGGAHGLNYAADYREVGGIIIPTTRRIYAWEGDYQLVPEPLLIAIDMGEITIRRTVGL